MPGVPPGRSVILPQAIVVKKRQDKITEVSREHSRFSSTNRRLELVK